jgi:hypothetical protein
MTWWKVHGARALHDSDIVRLEVADIEPAGKVATGEAPADAAARA